MKIVCDACGTKYSIADDRVAGKVFKIRCKKCSQIIVVRGGPASEPVEEPVAISGEWHVVIDGQQHGPLERAELLRRHAAGELEDDAYVWRDGMAEWAAFSSITELAEGSTRTATPATASSLFADSPPGAERAISERRVETASYVEASSPSSMPARAPDSKLRGERNENSVLFTLGNLAKLASPAPAVASAKPGTAGTEGSGLIDIRQLASTYAAKPVKAASTIGSMDDLPTFAPTTFGEPVVMVPTPATRGMDRRLVYALFATLAMLAIVASILIVVMLRDDSKEVAGSGSGTRVAQLGDGVMDGTGGASSSGSMTDGANGSIVGGANAATGTGSTGDADGAAGATAGGANTGGASNSTASGSTTTTGTRPTGTRPTGTTTGTRPTGTTTGTRPTGTRPTGTTGTRPTGTTGTRPTGTTTSTRPTGTTATTGTRPTAGPDRVQCEFSGYAEQGCEIYKPATSTTATSNRPENLDRNAIAAGLGTIKAQGCGARSSMRGDVAVQIKVNAEGGVAGVTIKSSPDPVLSQCVTAAIQKGTFAKTKRGASFGYVWRF